MDTIKYEVVSCALMMRLGDRAMGKEITMHTKRLARALVRPKLHFYRISLDHLAQMSPPLTARLSMHPRPPAFFKKSSMTLPNFAMYVLASTPPSGNSLPRRSAFRHLEYDAISGCDLRQSNLKPLFNLLQHLLIGIRAHKADTQPLCSKTSSTTDAMEIGVGIAR